jgi:uncharacterized protein YecE (DUF72 family)
MAPGGRRLSAIDPCRSNGDVAEKNPTLHVGTSGYSYKEWKGSFYPEDLPAAQMLGYYADRFGAVEINNTFYRMPKAAVLEDWATQVPENFRFTLKAPQSITHFKRLKDAGESVAYFLGQAGALGTRLGPLLFGLPPNFKKDLPRLRDFLALVPAETRVAFEFRHESWLDEEVFDALRQRRAALCVAETEDGPKAPQVATADWGYLRLRLPEYKDADLKRWLKWVRQQAWDDAFIFFKHENEARGPAFARRLLELAK